MRLLRDLRLIPVVALAAAALLVLKTASIVIEGGYTLIAAHSAQAQGLGEGNAAPAVDMPPPAALDDSAPVVRRGDRARVDDVHGVQTHSWVRDLYEPEQDITGSVGAKKEEPAKEPAKENAHEPAKKPPRHVEKEPGKEATAAPAPAPAPQPQLTPGERAVLESLQQRRQEIEARARELEVRDSLLKAAEKRIEQRLQELKAMEARLNGAAAKKDEQEATKFKGLVSMYENMKAKDAAKIFDRLDMRVLIEIANAMNPRRMSDILGQMTPEAAEKLTIEIANRAGAVGKPAQAPAPAELPKIEGRPAKS